MSTTQTKTPTPQHLVRFARRSARGAFLGLSVHRVTCLLAVVVIMVMALLSMVPGLIGVASLISVGLIFIVMKPWTTPFWTMPFKGRKGVKGGKPVADVLPTAAHYLVRLTEGQTSYRVHPNKPTVLGSMPLPGREGRLRFIEDPTTGAVMIHDPIAQTLVGIMHISHPGYALLAPDNQSRRVTGWARALAGLNATGTCARIQVLERSHPDTGQGISEWWDGHRAERDVVFATAEYDELMKTKAPSASSHSTMVAYCLDLRAAGKAVRDAGKGLAGGCIVLGQDMAAFEQSLKAAELGVPSWLSEGELARIIRNTYDPAAASVLDGTNLGMDLSTSGPMAVEEQWDHIRHDSGFSAVVWISEWPRTDVPLHFLHAIEFVGGVRHALSITISALSTEDAMADIRTAKVTNKDDAKRKENAGFVRDEAEDQELEDVRIRERALISGHADLRFTGLISITANTRDELTAAVSKVQRAATSAQCETRVLFGMQARSFPAASLPLALEVN